MFLQSVFRIPVNLLSEGQIVIHQKKKEKTRRLQVKQKKLDS